MVIYVLKFSKTNELKACTTETALSVGDVKIDSI